MPLLDTPSILATALAYLAVVVAIGLWALRRTRSPRDFYIAGQRLGIWVAGISMMTAAFSGFVFIGGPGLTYRIGVSALLICVPVSFTGAMLCWVVGERLRSLANDSAVLTLPDVFAVRYRSPVTTALAAVAILCGSVAYLGAQLIALGVVLRSALGLDAFLGTASPIIAIALGTAVVLFYSVTGGMLAGVYTDLVQGLLMTVAAVLVFFAALASGGGLGTIAERIASSPTFGPDFLDPLGNVPPTVALGFFFVFSIGVLGQPHMLHKFFMLRDQSSLRWMPLVLGGSQMLCVLIWLGIGLAVPALVASGSLPALTDPDTAAPIFLLRFTPPLLAGLAVAGVLAAIMSTADSFINIGAAALVRDLPKAFGRETGDELLRGRVASAFLAAAALVLALLFNDLVALVGTFAFGTFAAALAPALAIGLNWNGVTARAASASIVVGMTANVLLEVARRLELVAADVMPSMTALALSFLALLVASALDRAPSRPSVPTSPGPSASEPGTSVPSSSVTSSSVTGPKGELAGTHGNG